MVESTTTNRVTSLFRLKDFAVDNGYGIPEKLLADIAALKEKYSKAPQSTDQQATHLGGLDSADLDRLTIELSQITYPVTIANVHKVLDQGGITRFVYGVLVVGLLASFISGWLAWVIKHGAAYAGIAEAGLPLSLGVVGAIVYVMLPNGRLNVVAGLDAESIATNVVRIAMGGLLGFVLYVARFVAQSGNTPNIDTWTLFLPLIGGYSVTLVVGILAKAVAAAQLTLNIDEKSIRASLYK